MSDQTDFQAQRAICQKPGNICMSPPEESTKAMLSSQGKYSLHVTI